jgi:putative glutamine amidotransferase
MRPIVGITTSRHTLTSRAEGNVVYISFVAYTDMVRRAGGIPIALVPGPPDEAASILDRIDGLVLSGGGDVDPDRYGGPGHHTVYGVDTIRDEFEVALTLAARDLALPTLSICRGMQLMNVALGGTLIADIGDEGPGFLEHRRIDEPASTRQHAVEIEPGTTTAKALGATTVEVNSLHHQAIRDVAASLVVTGRAPDGIIESVAPADDTWPMWAVQWHPESLVDDEASLGLFRTFVAAAGE